MDLNIKGLDDDVGRRLRVQAEATGVSIQQYLHAEPTRIASRLSPGEFVSGHKPMTLDEFLSIRQHGARSMLRSFVCEAGEAAAFAHA